VRNQPKKLLKGTPKYGPPCCQIHTWSNDWLIKIAEDEKSQYPGDVTDTEVSEDEQNGHMKDLRSHCIGEVIVPKRKACPKADAFRETTETKTEGGKNRDALQPIKNAAVDYREDCRRNDVQDDD
jgi:hypothetical protein